MLGSDGNKMSKSLRNYPDVREVFDRDGADAMRWFLMSSPILRGGNLVVTEQGIRDSVRQVMIPLWNSWYFFPLYANAADDGQGYDAARRPAPTDPLDRYLLAKLPAVRRADHRRAGRLRGRGRVRHRRGPSSTCSPTGTSAARATGSGATTAEAFDTLYTVLETVCRVTAPLLPLTTEEVWRGLTGGRSVHLADWPLAAELPGRRRAASRHGQGARGLLGRRPRCARPATCATGCRSPR